MSSTKRQEYSSSAQTCKRPRLLSPFDQDEPCASSASQLHPAYLGVSAPSIIDVRHRGYPITPVSCSDASPAKPGTPAGLSAAPQERQYCCFGTLCEVKARILKDPSAFEELCIPTASGYMQLQIVHKRNYVLQDSNGLDLAVLNQKTADALRILDTSGSIRYEAYATSEDWKSGIETAKNTAGASVVDIEINIYGLHAKAEEVGRNLSDAHLFLQRPSVLATGAAYRNPHVISFTELQETRIDTAIPNAPEIFAVSTRKIDIQDVLGCLDQSGDLKLVVVDERRIKTKLREHQRGAVDFIIQREAATTPLGFSLWKPCQSNQQNCFRHTVLDIKKEHPPKENFGGIIADQMGLGKTLSMLAAISVTAEEANSFTSRSLNDSAQLRAKATLVIVPSALILQNWISEVDKHCAPGSMQHLKYHGPRRPTETAAILDKDVVLTTYETLSADFERGGSVLYRLTWFRIVLDEAHYICGQQTKRFCAVSALQAQHRWCLTGTPIQNRLDDLSSLIRFLKVPYLDNAFSFKNQISKPIEQNQAYGIQRLRSLLKSICLRRTAELLAAPEPTVCLRRLDFTDVEREAYNDVAQAHMKAMNELVSKANKRNSQLGLCQAILRLRRFCNTGCSARAFTESPTQNAEDFFSCLQQAGEATCACCLREVSSIGNTEDSGSGIFTACSHLLCRECISRIQPTGITAEFACPVCGIWSHQSNSEPSSHVQFSSLHNVANTFNTKLASLYRDITGYQSSEKGIIFTAWKDTITVISSLLTATNIPHRVVEGPMSIPDRKASLEHFESDPSCCVLLMTFGTGSAGLNLTAATNVHIVEPQWNPSVESQAIGRAVRIGQTKRVTVFKYIMTKTVEDYMENVQMRKAELASIGWDGDKENAANGKLKLIAKMVFDPDTPMDSDVA